MSTATSYEKPWWKNTTIRGITFKTRKELELHIRSIVNQAEIDAALPDADFDFMMDVLQHHPEFHEKATGAYDIVVRINKGIHFSNRGLWFLRADGSEMDISWPVALNAAPPSYGRMLRDAARYAVHLQIQAFRDKGGHKCAICGGAVDRKNVHVDHRPPYTFEALVVKWFGDVKDVAFDDTGLHPVFTDPLVAKAWQDFHELFSSLQITHASCNMSQGTGGVA